MIILRFGLIGLDSLLDYRRKDMKKILYWTIELFVGFIMGNVCFSMDITKEPVQSILTYTGMNFNQMIIIITVVSVIGAEIQLKLKKYQR